MYAGPLRPPMSRRFRVERRHDPYYRAAQAAGLRSRAAFKLEHLDDRFHLLRPGRRVLDLGAAPGGWSLVAARRVGASGRVVAVDPRPVEPIGGVAVVRGRVGDPRLLARLAGERFDLVLSDLSPRISGAYATDHARSVALARDAFRLARTLLAPGGAFVAKVFDGEMLALLDGDLAGQFARVQRTKPPASRAHSSELYVVALGFRGAGDGTGRASPRAPPASDIYIERIAPPPRLRPGES
jgi:23S rRNA (uridine2552-2'-O)-methyltransferase